MGITYQQMLEKKKNKTWITDAIKGKLKYLVSYMENLAQWREMPSGDKQFFNDIMDASEAFRKEGFSKSIREILDPTSEEQFNEASKKLNGLNEFFHRKTKSGVSYYTALMDRLNINELDDRKSNVDTPLSELNKALDLKMNLTDVEAEYNNKKGWVDPDEEYKERDEDVENSEKEINLAPPPLINIAPPNINIAPPIKNEIVINPPNIILNEEEKKALENMKNPEVIEQKAPVEERHFKLEEPFSKESINAYRIYFYNDEYKTGLEGLKKRIFELKNQLLVYSQNQSYDDEKDEVIIEGGKRYKAMVKAFIKMEEDLGDPNTPPSEIRESFINLYKTSVTYYNAHCGILWKPRAGTNERIRLDVADTITNIMPNLLNTYNNLRRSVCYIEDDKKNAYGNLPYAEIEKKANEFNKKYNFDIASPYFISKCVKRTGNEKLSYVNMELRSQDQLRMKKKIKGFTKTFARNYEYTRHIDDYLTIKPKMSITDKAKYFTAKKYLDKAYNPEATAGELMTMEENFSKDAFKKEYEALAKNPAFINIMKKYPKKGFSKWIEAEKKVEELIDGFNKELNEKAGHSTYYKINRWTSYVWQSQEGNGGQYESEEKKPAKAARIIALQILTSPKGRNLVHGLINDDQEKLLGNFVNYIADYLNRKGIIYEQNEIRTNKIAAAFSNNVLRENIIKDYSNKLQRDMKAGNRQPNNNIQNQNGVQNQNKKVDRIIVPK